MQNATKKCRGSDSPVLSVALCRTGRRWYLTVLREDGAAFATVHSSFRDALEAALLAERRHGLAWA